MIEAFRVALPLGAGGPWAMQQQLREALGAWPLRWALVGPAEGAGLWSVEGALWRGWAGPPPLEPPPLPRHLPGPGAWWAALVPTGVGAEVGGYAGDAGPMVAALAQAAGGKLLVNPNAVNAASLFALPAGAAYVEGRAFDDWQLGRWALKPGVRHRIGLLVDRGVEAMPEGSLALALQAAEAVRAVHGLDLVGHALTPRPLGARVRQGASGASGGQVADPEALLAGARDLMAAGATAIALMADLGPLPAEAIAAYEAGGAVDPIGGLEAVLSHAVVAALGLPCAHAPLWAPEGPLLAGDPRAAAEAISPSFLPCVLRGLAAHPALVPVGSPGALPPEDLAGLVMPQGALGGPGAMAAAWRGTPVLEVLGNRTVLGFGASELGQGEAVATPLEAVGWLAAAQAGVSGAALRRPMVSLPRIGPGEGKRPASLAQGPHRGVQC